MINIKEKEYSYSESDVINFAEGLIGLPEMRKAVLLPMSDYEPFYWLASLESEGNRFVVVNPHQIFTGYDVSEATKADLTTLAIVKISSDWNKTTINLRAPLFIDPETKAGKQVVLNRSEYLFAESLPQE